MTISKTALEEKLRQFIKEYVDDYYCLELSRFFGAYPCTRFNRLAIIHALSVNGGKLYIERALGRLIDKGVIKTYNVNSISLYSLTGEEPLHSLVSGLSKLNWHHWQCVLHRTNLINLEQNNTTAKHVVTLELAPQVAL